MSKEIKTGLIVPIDQRIVEYQLNGFELDKALGWESAVQSYKQFKEGNIKRASRLWEAALVGDPALETIRGTKVPECLGFKTVIIVTLIGMRAQMVPELEIQPYSGGDANWEKGELEATADILAGRVTVFPSAISAIKHLMALPETNPQLQ